MSNFRDFADPTNATNPVDMTSLVARTDDNDIENTSTYHIQPRKFIYNKIEPENMLGLQDIPKDLTAESTKDFFQHLRSVALLVACIYGNPLKYTSTDPIEPENKNILDLQDIPKDLTECHYAKVLHDRCIKLLNTMTFPIGLCIPNHIPDTSVNMVATKIIDGGYQINFETHHPVLHMIIKNPLLSKDNAAGPHISMTDNLSQ